VTEEEAAKSIQICLDEVDRCMFFIGMLGERYGWTPEQYLDEKQKTIPRLSWLKDYPAGRSITELEMHRAALRDPSKAPGAFFYIRDHTSFIRGVPETHRKFFDPSVLKTEKRCFNSSNASEILGYLYSISILLPTQDLS